MQTVKRQTVDRGHSGPASNVRSSPLQFIHRKCLCNGSAHSAGGCIECSSEQSTIQYRVAGSAGGVPAVVHDVLSSSGQPLDSVTRVFMESRFGHDFSRVRVHTDAMAADSAQAIDARAYTSGRDIVFGAGRYAPGTADGLRLLAHELAHVVQQAGSSTRAAAWQDGGIASEDHPSEREADRVADRVAAGGHAHIASSQALLGLQRQKDAGQSSPEDDCSGWEQDPQSFSIHVARFVAKTEINPILGRSLATTECQDDRQCDVTLEKAPTIRVLWNPANRRVLARFDSGGETKRYLYTYTCPGGQLTLKFLLTHHTPAPSASGPEGAAS